MLLNAHQAYGSSVASAIDLLEVAGDFWAMFFAGRDDVLAISTALRYELRQTQRRLSEEFANLNYRTVSPLRHETFWPLLVDPATITEQPIRYGEEDLFFGLDSHPVYYGQFRPKVWTLPIYENLADFAAISDATITPSYIAVNGVTAIRKQYATEVVIEFVEDPRTKFRTVLDEYGQSRLLLWIYMAGFDYLDIGRRFGTLFNRLTRTTTTFASVNRTVLDSWVYGASELRLRELLAACVDDAVAEADEVVEVILTTKPMPVVITSRRTIVGTPGKLPVVDVGDVLDEGDLFFDSIRFTDFRDGVPDWLSSLELPPRVTGLSETVAVPNEAVAITWSGDTFSAEFASSSFWNWVRTAYPNVTAQLLSYYGVDRIVDLPSEMNLASFFGQVFFRGKLSVSVVRSEFLTEQAPHLLSLHREITPPWTTHLIQFDGDPPQGWTDDALCTPGVQLLSRS